MVHRRPAPLNSPQKPHCKNLSTQAATQKQICELTCVTHRSPNLRVQPMIEENDETHIDNWLIVFIADQEREKMAQN